LDTDPETAPVWLRRRNLR